MGRIHKEYYSANARFLSDETIKEIKTSFGRVPDAINTMAKKHRISYIRVKEYIENRERKQQMIYSHSSQIQSAISPEIISMSLDPKGHCFAINEQLENNHISLLQGRPLGDKSEIQDSVSSLNHGSSSLHTSDNILDKQTKKRRPKSKSVRISDPTTIIDTPLEQVLNEGEKQIECSDYVLNTHKVTTFSNS